MQILTELELYKTDPSFYEKIIKSIADFQNSIDVESFAAVKVLEIAKLKILLRKDAEQKVKDKEDAERIKEQQVVNFENYTFNDWPFGVTLDELKISHKDRRFFKKKTKDRSDKNTGLTLHYPNEVTFHLGNNMPIPDAAYFNDIYGILTKDNVVKGYRELIYSVEVNNTENISLEKSLTEVEAIVANITAFVGFESEYEEGKYVNKAYRWGTYRWSKQNKTIKLHRQYYHLRNGYWFVNVVKEIIQH